MARKQARKPNKGRRSTASLRPRRGGRCPIVALGASAGGLDAFQRFFSNLPAGNGMAFILVPHLDAHHKSAMVDLLSAYAAMPVVEVADRVPVEPDRVYVIPPNATLSIKDGILRTVTPRSRVMTIDDFFRSLAEDQGENAIGVIL